VPLLFHFLDKIPLIGQPEQVEVHSFFRPFIAFADDPLRYKYTGHLDISKPLRGILKDPRKSKCSLVFEVVLSLLSALLYEPCFLPFFLNATQEFFRIFPFFDDYPPFLFTFWGVFFFFFYNEPTTRFPPPTRVIFTGPPVVTWLRRTSQSIDAPSL